jgi:hypothetical protein
MASDASGDIPWSEAVARIAREKAPAENCVALLKAFGNPAAVALGSIAYTDAKGEYDAVISGLTVALAGKQAPNRLEDLQARLESGFAKREAFCQSVTPLIPDRPGRKGVLAGVVGDVVKGAIGPLLDAVKALYLGHQHEDALRRKAIQTQLEAAMWRDFTAIPAATF